jgi:hypothetical protein
MYFIIFGILHDFTPKMLEIAFQGLYNPSQKLLRLAYLSVKLANSYPQELVLPPTTLPPPSKQC